MGVFSKAISKTTVVTGNGYQLGHSLYSSTSGRYNAQGKIDSVEEFQGYAWKAIDVRTTLLSSEDLFVERLVGKQWQPDNAHEFNDVLEGGLDDSSMDLSEILELYEQSQCLFGESFMYFSKGQNSNKPHSVYILDPRRMVVFVAQNKITGYKYQTEGGAIIFDTDEIVYKFKPGWQSPFRGMGPMQAAGLFIKESRYVNTFVNNFMEGNAIPSGVVVAKGNVSDTDWELFKKQWSEKYSGIDNVGKTGYIRGEDLSFVKTGMSLGDIDLSKIKNTTRDDVMMMFGVSKPMYAIFEDINRASATTARQLAAITLTEPTLMGLRRKLSKKVAKWYGAQYRIGSSNPVPEDEDAKLQTLKSGVGRWITVNEARAASGYQSLPDKEHDTINPNLADTTTNGGTTKAFLAPSTLKVRIKSAKKSFTTEEKETFRKATEALQFKYEDKFYKNAIPVIEAQKKLILSKIQPKKAIDTYIDEQKEVEALTLAVEADMLELVELQGILAARLVKGDDATFTVTSVIEKYIKDSIRMAALGFTKDTLDKVAKAVAEGIQSGLTLPEIAKSIETVYEEIHKGKLPGYRLERIARYETIKASNEITETAYKESGVVMKKEWYANPGACGYCQNLHGSTVSLGMVFIPKGGTLEDAEGNTRVVDYEDIHHPPAHSGCRCTTLPVIREQDGF